MSLLYHGAGGRFNWILREVERMGEIPKDPAMLLSYVNLKLRDFYPDLEELCRSLDIEREKLEKTMASIGYGIAYPFGVISVVLFVQLMPKILRVDVAAERKRFEAANSVELKPYTGKLFSCDSVGLFPFSIAIALGLLLAAVTIPLPGGSGGPLIVGLIVGHLGHLGSLDLSVNKRTLESFREFGLMMFLIGAGTDAGSGFVATLQEHGFLLFVYGAIIALLPMLVGYFVAAKLLKLSIFNSLGSITGGMTSTPALGTLIRVAGTDDVASAYAATYPIALVCVVLASQFLAILL